MSQELDFGPRMARATTAYPGQSSDPRVVATLSLAIYLVALTGMWLNVAPVIPEQITLAAFGITKTISDVPSRILRDASVMFGILPFAFWVECMVVGWNKSSLKRLISAPTASMQADMALFALGQVYVLNMVSKILLIGASMISGSFVREWVLSHTGFAIDPSGLPFGVQLVLFFYLATFFDYWTHRLDHTRLFWPIHRYHHSAKDFCVLTTSRQHPAAFTQIIMINVPMALLGADTEVMIFVNVFVTTLGFIIHSEIKSDWGWIGRWVVQSPLHHRLHHKLDMTERTGHFGMAPIWDHVFGTWYDNAEKYPEIGVAKTYRNGVWFFRDIMRDYFDFWKGLVVRNTDPA